MPIEPPDGFTDDSIALLENLVAIPSPTGGERAAAEAISSIFDDAGIENRIIAPANVLANVEGGRPGPRRLFTTHTDTMSPAVMSEPFQAVRVSGERFGVDGDVIRGLGASAPKSAVAAMVSSYLAVASHRDELRGSVTLAAVTKDLEADHAGVKEVVAEVPIEADWAVVSEPSENKVVVGARGIAHVRIEFSGVAAHCGRPHEAVNPLFAVEEMLTRIRSAKMPDDPQLGAATLVPFEVGSDASPPKSPETGWIVVDRRTLPSETTEAVLEALRADAEAVSSSHEGMSYSVTPLKAMHPFSIPPDADLVVAARRSIEGILGRDPGTTSISFSSNAGYISRVLGIPSIGFGPGNIAALGRDEYVPVAEVAEAAAAYLALMTGSID